MNAKEMCDQTKIHERRAKNYVFKSILERLNGASLSGQRKFVHSTLYNYLYARSSIGKKRYTTDTGYLGGKVTDYEVSKLKELGYKVNLENIKEDVAQEEVIKEYGGIFKNYPQKTKIYRETMEYQILTVEWCCEEENV